MTRDIFKLFKSSIEQVSIKNTDRASITKSDPTVDITIDAIVKRRNKIATSTETSEDYNNDITIHFRPSDAQYIKIGYYAQVDNEWHSIKEVKDGKNFHTGLTEFLYVTLDNDIIPEEEDPVWQQILSA